MAQAKKKQATKTTKRTAEKKTARKSSIRYERYQRGQRSNEIFVISMSVLAASLLFADLLMMNV